LVAGLFDTPEPAPGETDAIGAIACFVVAPEWRRRGVAGALLRAASAGFVEQGFVSTEAYPRRNGRHAVANHLGRWRCSKPRAFSSTRRTKTTA
jgi:GNAT superfamily N-acetyltransferase